MIIIKQVKKMKEFIGKLQSKNTKIGFVPTMGALHNGHICLIKISKSENDSTVCSIYVNPTQFNNESDLQKYPVTIEKDIDQLEKSGCDILFLPSTSEIYPDCEENEHYNLGTLETILEGKYRPGHFQGVCIIVDKLLKIVEPTILYLGKKDYQQCMVIGKMIKSKQYDIKVTLCDTIREEDGLAMSSRNMRLNETERITALKIIKALQNLKNNIKPGSVTNLKNDATNFLTANGYKVDYTEIADAETLEPVTDWDGERKIVALVAAYLNDVRLIDNLIL